MRYAQLSLDGFDAPSAKIVAITRVESNADPHWMASARAELETVARLHDEFSTDAVWERLANHDTPLPREPRAMGAIMRKAARDGLIEPTGRYTESSREVNHQRPVMIWRSLVR